MRWILLALIFVVGLLQPVQAGLNATLAKSMGSRFQAGMTNGAVNLMLLSVVVFLLSIMASREGFSLSGFRGLPWWAYLGGAIGAAIVVVQLSAAPVLGAALMIAVFVAGQCLGSLMVDTVGFPGYERKSIDYSRLVGLVFVFIGAILVAKPWAGVAENAS
jgi:transporter family-2 protein